MPGLDKSICCLIRLFRRFCFLDIDCLVHQIWYGFRDSVRGSAEATPDTKTPWAGALGAGSAGYGYQLHPQLRRSRVQSPGESNRRLDWAFLWQGLASAWRSRNRQMQASSGGAERGWR